MLVKVIEEEFEDGIKFIDHLRYTVEVNGLIFGQSIVVALAATLRRQIRKVVDAILGSVVVLVQLLLPDHRVEWIENK